MGKRGFGSDSAYAPFGLTMAIALVLASVIEPHRSQREAVARLRREGGAVEYAYEYAAAGSIPARLGELAPSGFRKRLADVFGPDYFWPVASVTLRYTGSRLSYAIWGPSESFRS